MVDALAEWDLDPAVAHLNHGSYGAVPRTIAAHQEGWRQRAESDPMQFFARDIDALIDEARLYVAARLGCDVDGFAFVPNVTAAANVVMNSLALRQGDRVLMTDHAYGAVRMTFEEGARRAGAHVDVVSIPLGASDPQDLIAEAVRPRTRLAVVDHITSPTATILPINQIVSALKKLGVEVFVDAAHAPGMMEVDAQSLGADYWAGNFHKWLCAPRASGGMWVSPEHRAGIRPLVTSWRADEGYPGSFGWWGTQDFSPYLTVPRAFGFLDEIGPRLRHNHDLVISGTAIVREAIGEPDIEGRDPAHVGWMDLVPLPPGVVTSRDGARLLSQRISEELKAQVAVSAWDTGFIRLSAHVYNSAQEFERLAHGLSGLLNIPKRS